MCLLASRRHLQAVLLALLLAGCGAPDGESGQTTPGERTGAGSLVGVVVDEAIRPVANATVAAVPTGGEPLVSSSDAEGRFILKGLKPGAYIVDVTAAGFFPARVAASVLASAADPPVLQVQLATDASTTPYVVAFKDDGYFQACVGYCASYADLLLDGNLCNPTGICPGHVFDDANLFYHPHTDNPLPGWIQTEVVWTPTLAQTQEMMIGHYYHTDGGPPTWGQFGPLEEPNRAIGASPLLVETPPGLVLAEAEQDPPDSRLGFNADRWGLALFVYPWSELEGHPVAFQQRFQAFTHYFYSAQPAEGWRFTADGEPTLRPWP